MIVDICHLECCQKPMEFYLSLGQRKPLNWDSIPSKDILKKKKSEAEIKTKRQAHAERMNLCWICYARVFAGHSQVRRRRYLRS